jgi:hypothetical protein
VALGRFQEERAQEQRAQEQRAQEQRAKLIGAFAASGQEPK